jgi:glycerol-3-phosphate dehydrogenase
LLGQVFDVAVIGGGISGTAVARDAAGRGLSVFLCDQGDLGGGSSSATSKLVHGGLDYLSGLRFGALRTALVERERLAAAAPHLVRPLRLLLPHHDRQWPQWALDLGLFAADHLAPRSLPSSRRIDLEAENAHGALATHFRTAFAFSDCLVDDSRMVILNAVDARTRGASIHPRLRLVVAERDGESWRLSLESALTGERVSIAASVLVNAAGPAAGPLLDHAIHTDKRVRVRLTRHSHVVLKRRHDGGAYALPSADGRIVYAIPFEHDFTLIGPASVPHDTDHASARVEPREVAHLLDVASQYFEAPPDPADIVWSFASVSALPADHAASRGDWAMVVDAPPHLAPVISVFGGTLTSHRRVAEAVVDRIGRYRSVGRRWTARSALPGGNIGEDGVGGLARALRGAYPFISGAHAARLAAAYGTRAQTILSGARRAADLGMRFGSDLTEAEVLFLRHEEWAATADDVLWRRSKLGLVLSSDEAAALGDWMDSGQAAAALAMA